MTSGAFRAVLNWGDRVQDLDIFSIFRVSKYIECNVYFGSKSCVSTKLETDNKNYGNAGGETILVEKLGKYNYVFAVNKYQDRSNGVVVGEYNESTDDYQEENIPATVNTTPITASNAKVYVYSPHYLNSIIDINISSNINQSNVIGDFKPNESYNWWVLFCIDGTNGMESLKLVNKFMASQPTSKFCDDILKPPTTTSTTKTSTSNNSTSTTSSTKTTNSSASTSFEFMKNKKSKKMK